MANVMIVDDSGMMRRTLGLILERIGHTIITEAANGKQAIQEYAQHLPDLVTMDITMPTMNGLDAMQQILFDYPDAKIIVISALGHKDKIFAAIQNGAKHYILKPFTIEKVVSVVDKVLKEGREGSQ